MADHNRYSVDARAAPDGAGALHAERVVVMLARKLSRIIRAASARPDHLRSLALPAGADEEARRLAQWRAVQGLDLPPALTQVRVKLKQHATETDSSSRCWAPCSIMDWPPSKAPAPKRWSGHRQRDVILTVLARQRQPAAPPASPRLTRYA